MVVIGNIDFHVSGPSREYLGQGNRRLGAENWVACSEEGCLSRSYVPNTELIG